MQPDNVCLYQLFHIPSHAVCSLNTPFFSQRHKADFVTAISLPLFTNQKNPLVFNVNYMKYLLLANHSINAVVVTYLSCACIIKLLNIDFFLDSYLVYIQGVTLSSLAKVLIHFPPLSLHRFTQSTRNGAYGPHC